MTDAQKLRILALSHDLRKVAAPVGSMHAFWDLILDLEAFVKGQPTVVKNTAEGWIAEAEQRLAEHSAKK